MAAMAAILDFRSPMLPSKFVESIGLSVQEKLKIDFQDGGHLAFLTNDFSDF